MRRSTSAATRQASRTWRSGDDYVIVTIGWAEARLDASFAWFVQDHKSRPGIGGRVSQVLPLQKVLRLGPPRVSDHWHGPCLPGPGGRPVSVGGSSLRLDNGPERPGSATDRPPHSLLLH